MPIARVYARMLRCLNPDPENTFDAATICPHTVPEEWQSG